MSTKHNSKNILVTGGTEGLGRQIAETFRDNDWGVVILGRQAAKTAEAAKALGVEHVVADVTDAQEVQLAAKHVAERMGRIGVLVNNAGIQPHGEFFDMDPADMHRMVATNLMGPIIVTHAFAPLVERPGGRIFNIGSYAGHSPAESAPVYSASKAGLAAFSEAIGKDLRREGVSTTLITPGALEMDVVDANGMKKPNPGGVSYRDVADHLLYYANGPDNVSPEAVIVHGLERWKR